MSEWHNNRGTGRTPLNRGRAWKSDASKSVGKTGAKVALKRTRAKQEWPAEIGK